MARARDLFVLLAAALSALLVVYFLYAALGTRFGLHDWRFGFGQLTLTHGPTLILGTLGVGVLALLLALLVKPRRGRGLALAALLVPALGLGAVAFIRADAQRAPPIHDVTTDLLDPPGFSDAVLQARAAVPGVNGLDLAAKRVPENPRFGPAAGRLAIDLHREAYGDLAPIPLARDPAAAFEAARAAARQLGWRIVRADPTQRVIEAQAQSFWFGFVDDIAIRIRPSDAGAVVDVRSVSRVGVSDLGANARRIRAFEALLRDA